jgi:diketogulonate reductase-like aldo/keto reductase
MKYKLNTGREMAAIGFGTWQINSRDAKEAVLYALKTGYRVIDTAKIYGNEEAVGEAIRESGLRREDVFVTTKLWNDDQGYDSALRACETSLEKLGLDYLDLYLIHWPATAKRHESWRAMGQLLSDGKIKAAGVSNFTVEHLQDLMHHSELLPAVNQVEFHPFIYEQQKALLKYCADQGILIEAYSPLNRLSKNPPPAVSAIAKQHGQSPQQVVLRWCIQHGTLPLPRSTNPGHMRSNFDIFDFKLSGADMKAINSLSDGERVTWDPAGMG